MNKFKWRERIAELESSSLYLLLPLLGHPLTLDHLRLLSLLKSRALGSVDDKRQELCDRLDIATDTDLLKATVRLAVLRRLVDYKSEAELLKPTEAIISRDDEQHLSSQSEDT